MQYVMLKCLSFSNFFLYLSECSVFSSEENCKKIVIKKKLKAKKNPTQRFRVLPFFFTFPMSALDCVIVVVDDGYS